jgi:hypothetical protein
MELRYIILEKPPFPAYWQPTKWDYLQSAEFQTFAPEGFDGKWAHTVGVLVTYTLINAQALMNTLKQQHDSTEYMLFSCILDDE